MPPISLAIKSKQILYYKFPVRHSLLPFLVKDEQIATFCSLKPEFL